MKLGTKILLTIAGVVGLSTIAALGSIKQRYEGKEEGEIIGYRQGYVEGSKDKEKELYWRKVCEDMRKQAYKRCDKYEALHNPYCEINSSNMSLGSNNPYSQYLSIASPRWTKWVNCNSEIFGRNPSTSLTEHVYGGLASAEDKEDFDSTYAAIKFALNQEWDWHNVKFPEYFNPIYNSFRSVNECLDYDFEGNEQMIREMSGEDSKIECGISKSDALKHKCNCVLGKEDFWEYDPIGWSYSKLAANVPSTAKYSCISPPPAQKNAIVGFDGSIRFYEFRSFGPTEDGR